MEKELFFSGYCKQLDNGRMVEAVLEDGKLTEVDCCFPECPFAPGCPIAINIQDALNL